MARSKLVRGGADATAQHDAAHARPERRRKKREAALTGQPARLVEPVLKLFGFRGLAPVREFGAVAVARLAAAKERGRPFEEVVPAAFRGMKRAGTVVGACVERVSARAGRQAAQQHGWQGWRRHHSRPAHLGHSCSLATLGSPGTAPSGAGHRPFSRK